VFNNLGWPELLMLLLFGLLIFGPDQLPKIAGDLGRMIRQLRKLANDASVDLRNELGPEFGDVDLASLNPRRFIEKHMLGDDEDEQTNNGAAPNSRPPAADTSVPSAEAAAAAVGEPDVQAGADPTAEPGAEVSPAPYEYNPSPYDYDAT
jgi:sec-independent protein translocase protein TatB